jgi:hypothetical protein
VLQPCSGRVGQEQGEVTDDEAIIIRATGLAGKLVVLKPKAEVRLPRVLEDVSQALGTTVGTVRGGCAGRKPKALAVGGSGYSPRWHHSAHLDDTSVTDGACHCTQGAQGMTGP